MQDSFKIVFILIAFICASTVAFVLLILAYGASVGSIPSPSSDTDVFFAYFSNSIGISIGLVGTSLAIVLAFNALRATEIQTTTVALQEFRGEIDGFVSISNSLFDQFLDVLLKSAYWAEAANSLALAYYEYNSHGNTACEAMTDALDTEVSNSASIEECHAEYIREFNNCKAEFSKSVAKLHELLSGDGNIFIRLMVEENIRKEQSCFDAIKAECADSSPIEYHDLWSIKEVKSELTSLSLLKGLSYLPALNSLNYEDNYEYFATQQSINLEIIRFIEDGGALKTNRFSAISDHLSNYLPVLVAQGDYGGHPIAYDKDGREVSEYNLLVSEFPVFERIGDVIKNNRNSKKIFMKMLPLYASLINPESGLEAMKKYFKEFGAKKDVLKLFVDTHSARLAYNYRREAYMFSADK